MSPSSTESNYFRHLRPEILERFPRRATRVLEIGCGEGYFGSSLLRNNLADQVIGVEPNLQACKVAEQHLTAAHCVSVENLSACEEPFSTPFDAIILNDVLEHALDPDAFLTKLTGLLRGDGFFLVSLPNVQFHKVVRKLVFQGDWTYTDEGVLDRTHLRFFTRRSALTLFTRHGLSPVKIEGINAAPFPRWLTLVNLLSFRRFEDMRYQQFFIYLEKTQG